MTRLDKQNEIFERPAFSKFSDSNGMKALVQQALLATAQQLYGRDRLIANHWEKTATLATLPAGSPLGANGQLFLITLSTTPPLPNDIVRVKSLEILNGSTSRTPSSSTYDTDDAEGSGIPQDPTVALGVSDVYHELIGDETVTELDVYSGSTASGTTPGLRMKYVRTQHALATDADVIDVPDYLFLNGDYDAVLDTNLRRYVGFSE